MKLGLIAAAMLQLASPTGSGYSEEWTIKVKAGDVIHGFALETNLVNKSTIKKITLDIGGTPIATQTGARLELIDDLYQVEKTAGYLVWDLAKFDMRSPTGVYQTSLATSVFDDITLKIEFGAQGAGDPAVPTLKAKKFGSVNVAKNIQGGGRRHVPMGYELVQYSAAAGTHEWSFPGGNVNRAVQRLFFDESEVAISRVRVKRGETVIREMYRSDIDAMLKRYGAVSLQADTLLLDFVLFGFGRNDALTTEGLNFEFEVDGAGAIKTYVDGFEAV